MRKGYEQFQFRQVVHEIDYFCSTDMSATYLDILKDRLYTFPANSPLSGVALRRCCLKSSQRLAKLMAPILSFTAEEIWQALPDSTVQGPKPMSVHIGRLSRTPTVFQDPHLQTTWNYLLQVRRKVQSALEKHDETR